MARGSVQRLGADWRPVPKNERAVHFRAFYRDAARRNVGRTFNTRAEAEAWLKERGKDELTGALGDSRAGRKTMQALWTERHESKPYAANTVAIHNEVWGILGPVLGPLPVSGVDSAKITKALARFASPSMRAKARSVLSMLFGYAIRQRYVTVNPVPRPDTTTRRERLDVGKSSAKEAERYLDDAQLSRLLAEFDRDTRTRRYVALVNLMARMGLRPGEALALRVGDFDPLHRTLLIERSVHGETKTGEARTLTLPAAVAESLVAHVAAWSKGKGRSRAALMFPTGQGSMFTLGGFRTVFQRASVRAEVNHGLSPNHLRHTAAAFAIHHGATVYDVQRMLGHAKPSITLDTYGYLWDTGQSRLAGTLDAAIREAEGHRWQTDALIGTVGMRHGGGD